MNFADKIDHTLLKAECTSHQIQTLCQEALDHQFFGVCVNTSWLSHCVNFLRNTSVRKICVVGFPLGAMASESKASETKWAIAQGADEIDMVIHLGHLKEKKALLVKDDIRAVVEAAQGKPVKVILETGLLNQEEKKWGCEWSVEAGAHFVKTCTGFQVGAATVEDIRLMRSLVGPQIGVKASGGIRSTAQALALIEAGANRLGTSSGVQLIQGLATQSGY